MLRKLKLKQKRTNLSENFQATFIKICIFRRGKIACSAVLKYSVSAAEVTPCLHNEEERLMPFTHTAAAS
jgi:hypothetical protein